MFTIFMFFPVHHLQPDTPSSNLVNLRTFVSSWQTETKLNISTEFIKSRDEKQYKNHPGMVPVWMLVGCMAPVFCGDRTGLDYT
ncbi:hypothetical protein L0128_14605 [candidate division KSB1 bacterium]|nr:hypothetical protein [candidate division KSB1 bacterium]